MMAESESIERWNDVIMVVVFVTKGHVHGPTVRIISTAEFFVKPETVARCHVVYSELVGLHGLLLLTAVYFCDHVHIVLLSPRLADRSAEIRTCLLESCHALAGGPPPDYAFDFGIRILWDLPEVEVRSVAVVAICFVRYAG